MTGGGQFIQAAGDGTGAGGKREEEIEGERERKNFIFLLLSRVDNTVITCMILFFYYLYASSPFTCPAIPRSIVCNDTSNNQQC